MGIPYWFIIFFFCIVKLTDDQLSYTRVVFTFKWIKSPCGGGYRRCCMVRIVGYGPQWWPVYDHTKPQPLMSTFLPFFGSLVQFSFFLFAVAPHTQPLLKHAVGMLLMHREKKKNSRQFNDTVLLAFFVIKIIFIFKIYFIINYIKRNLFIMLCP